MKNTTTYHKGKGIPFDRDNIDTDQIIPKQFLKSIKKSGFGPNLFDAWRYEDEGFPGQDINQRKINKDFILNIPPFDESKILLSRSNFGCGSSREHAVWALRDFGIKAVIASSFGDIFYNNCFKNNVLPIRLQKNEIDNLFTSCSKSPCEINISLDNMKVSLNDFEFTFEVKESLLERIIYKLDDIDITMQKKDVIKKFESQRIKEKPWIFVND